MWNGKMKALTFSYDDGVQMDRRLAELFDRYGMKCTFNLNSGLFQSRDNLHSPWNNKGVMIYKLPTEDMPEVYKNHEIAAHSFTHPHLEKLTREECTDQIVRDIDKLTEVFGKRPIGMAYPYGTYSDMVVDVLKEQGIKYSRTVGATRNFELQSDLLRFDATCHHNDGKLMELAEKFVNMKPDKPQLFYVWGHSYEFDVDNNWEVIERFCEYMAGRDDIFYGTNAEVLL